jgi:hypothetical protein
MQLDPFTNSLNTSGDIALPFQETGGIESTTQVQNFRRRNFTKEEKEEFEQWITNNPKPNKSQKADYAKTHNLTCNQLQNLINNRKRKTRAKGTEFSAESNETSSVIQSFLAKQQEIQAQIALYVAVSGTSSNLDRSGGRSYSDIISPKKYFCT